MRTSFRTALALALGAGFCCANQAWAGVIYVDSTNCDARLQLGTRERPFCTIQAAINAAVTDDVVLVMDGLYDTDQDTDLDFQGKRITVRSENGPLSTIIESNGDAAAAIFDSNETAGTVLEGFTLMGGAESALVYCSGAHPTIRNCMITGNPYGHGVELQNSNALFIDCQITENERSDNGAGILINGGSPSFVNAIIADNRVTDTEGGPVASPILVTTDSFGSLPDGSSIALHPNVNNARYYYGSNWTTTNNVAYAFNRFGQQQHVYDRYDTVFLARAWHYNPNNNRYSKVIEVVTQGARTGGTGKGLYSVELNADGTFRSASNIFQEFSRIRGLPHDECVPAFDPVNQVFYARGTGPTVSVVPRCDCAATRTFDLKDVPALTDYVIGYNPVTRHVLTTERNGFTVYIHDLQGNLIGTDEISIAAPAKFGVGFTSDSQVGNRLFVYNASNMDWYGFAIRGEESSVRAGSGGGLCAINATVTMVNCVIAGNQAGVQGGGLYLHASSASLMNCLLVGNQAPRGAAVGTWFAPGVNMANCTVADNAAGERGGGLWSGEASTINVGNSIFWNNAGGEIDVNATTGITVTYSNVLGGWPGTGNLDVDPLFAGGGAGQSWAENDYRLQSASPCCDAGSNPSVIKDSLDLDADGDRNELTPLDLDLSARFIDNEEVDDTGNAGGGYNVVVDMGPYELLPYCVGDELPPPADIAGKVDFEATADDPNGILPAEAAFYHACVEESAGQCVRSAIFAGEAGASVLINWKYKENPNDHVYLERQAIYRIGRCIRPGDRGYAVAGVRFFKAYGEADVVLNQLHHVTVQYNGLIRENVPEDDNDPPREPDIMVLSTGQVQVSEDCPDGLVVLRYDRHLGGPLVGLEVLEVTSEGATRYDGPLGGAVPIGRRLESPSEPGVENCHAVVIRNYARDGVPVAWQHADEPAQIYPIRPEDDSFAFIVGWYELTALENCWPVAVLRYQTDWPTDPQFHVIDEHAERGEIPAGSRVDLRSDVYCDVEIMYQQGFAGGDPPFSHLDGGFFAARKPGYSVVRFDRQPDEISRCGAEVFFEVVESYDRTDPQVLAPADQNVPWPIGEELTCRGDNCGCTGDCDDYFDDEARTFPRGFLFIPETQESAPYAVDIHAQTGQIFPVNTSAQHGLLEAWWYRQGAYAEDVYWPNKLVTYDAQWLADDGRIVIASRRGAERYPDGLRGYPPGSQIYNTGSVEDVELETPGFNPNDEHAVLLPVGGVLKIWAVRDDNPWDLASGHPWVIVQYPDADREGLWKLGVHSVVAESAEDDFYFTEFTAIDQDCGCGEDGKCRGGWSEGQSCSDDDDCLCEIDFPVVAGQPIDPLFPVNFGAAICYDDEDPPQPHTYVVAITGEALWVDRKGGIWAVEDQTDDGLLLDSEADIYIWENWAGDYGCQPWLADGPGGEGGDGSTPWPVTYNPAWPDYEGECIDGSCRNDSHAGESCNSDLDCGCDRQTNSLCAPLRHIGASFDQSGQCGSIEILHDTVGVRILDPRREVFVDYPSVDVDLLALPPHLHAGEIGGGGEWPDRIFYDFATGKLGFRGIMSDRDAELLLALDPGCSSPNHWCDAIDELRTLSREQIHDPQFKADGASKFVSLSDQAAVEGWVTLAFQNDQACVDSGLPVSVEVWRVECPPDRGFIRPIVPVCPLSEKQVLQFSGDAGGEPERLYYQWQWSIDYDSTQPELATWNDYAPPQGYEDGAGLREVVIEGASLFTLQDSYWRVRYRGYPGCPCTEGQDCNEGSGPYDEWLDTLGGQDTQISDWTDVQLAEGWVKRVIRGINPFDQRVEEFHVNDAATYVEMIRQAGKRFVDPVPLNCTPDNIDGVGLIELYETVLRRARAFSIDQGVSTDGITQALLLVSGKIADLHMLLGNEALADGFDPTVGAFAEQGDSSGAYDPHAVFCFEEQAASLLEEELALLRGRDVTRAPDYDADGVLIATVDNRLPWNFTSGNGQVAYANNYQLLDVEQAVASYPQGHGDAWGYYLQALRKFYALMQHPIFEWVVATEDVLVHGQPVHVGFMYERKFAAAAAAKARSGAAIASLTFRQLYSSDPLDPQRGYPDADGARAWGLADWGRRAGQGAYLDWMTANALLPSEDAEHEGIEKIDRTTVRELREIAAAHTEIQTLLDQADAALSPLGLAANVVPFALDPGALEDGATHFDQIAQAALVAVNNAATAFDYANADTQRLRAMQDSLERFDDLVEQSELDYKARLIEIFGRPFSEDIGPGGAYPDGYEGPDIFHFAYEDASALLREDGVTSDAATRTTQIELTFDRPDFSMLEDFGQFEDLDVWTVSFEVSTDGLGLIKPKSWGSRPEPGEIQFARAELLQAIGRYQQSLAVYAASLDQIQDQTDLLEALFQLNDEVLGVMTEGQAEQVRLNQLIAAARSTYYDLTLASQYAVIIANAVAEALPGEVGLANDVTSVARSAIRLIGGITAQIGQDLANDNALTELMLGHDKEVVSLTQQLTITGLENAYQEHAQVNALKQSIRSLAAARLQLFTLEEAIKEATGRYNAALGRGLRLLEQRTVFRDQTADQITQYRYRDMAFRVFRNDALAKYRAQFDLAAQYVMLAAKAYDYETNLLGTDPQSGQRFLSDIVRERTIGVISNGQPYVGNGLAGKLAEMVANFQVLRRDLGLSNHDVFQRTFSLRWELFRIPNSTSYDAAWRQALTDSIVADINTSEIYRQYCQALQPARTVEPAIVIPFGTSLASGLNLFGRESNGDELLPPDRYSIKIQSFNVGFSQSYASPPLNKEAHVYLIPAGADVMRVPTDASLRQWSVLDQVLPVPFPISQADVRQPDWMPWDTLVGGPAAMTHRHRIPTVTGCPLTQTQCDASYKLTGRSIWNTQWYLIIPGSQLMGEDPDRGIDLLINGESGAGVRDIKLMFQLYGYSGSVPSGSGGGS